MGSAPSRRYPLPSLRYSTSSMTIAGPAHSAPSGGTGIDAKGGSGSGTNIVNAIHSPSGDHASSDGDSVTWLSLASCPLPSIHRSQIWVPSSPPSEAYRRRSPSGDQRGDPSPPSPAVSAR